MVMNKQKQLIALIGAFVLFAVLSCSNEKKEDETNSISIPTSSVKHPFWSKDAVIYEVNIRQHTAEGTFKALETDIPRLKDLGIDILWLMPIHPVGELNKKGSLGSYYAVRDYKAINPEFGTEKDLRSLISTAHDNGMKVIIDWVANHTAWDHVWTETNKAFYALSEAGEFVPPVDDWSDVIDLDYSNEDMRAEMLDALKYWVSEFDIDGYRCDVAEMVPMDFWDEVRKELDAIKPVFMLAEGEDPELHLNAFDMSYSWELMHLMREVAAGEKSTTAIKEMYERDFARFPEGYVKMNIITNHDENSWNGTAEEFFGPAQEAWTVFAATTYGMPLVYSGQEANNTKRLEFFEKDPIDWSGGYKFEYLMKSLFNLKAQNPALWNGQGSLEWIPTVTDESIMVFKRVYDEHEVLVMVNTSDEIIEFEIDRAYPAMIRIFGGGIVTVEKEQKIGPYGFKVFAK